MSRQEDLKAFEYLEKVATNTGYSPQLRSAAVRLMQLAKKKFEEEEKQKHDPGEGYRLLHRGLMIEEDDEHLLAGAWCKTAFAGTVFGFGDSNIYRRKICVEPTESPNDWVTQDRVLMREGDQGQWDNNGQTWWWADNRFIEKWQGKARHGMIDPDDGLTLSVRCRRKDLPPLESEPATKRVAVDLIATKLGNVIWREHGARLHPTDRFIFKDGNGGWFVEVPQ